jgi:TonB family protein
LLKGDFLMRQAFMATLVLLPVLAHAQASTATGAPQSTPSTTLQAKVVAQPISFARSAATPATAPAANTASVSPAREVVQAQVDPSFLEQQMQQGGSIAYTFLGSSSHEPTAPRLVHVVGREIPVNRLSADNDVAVHLIVAADGTPRNLTIAKSAGSEMDQKTLLAVSQYRFTPATLNNHPVEAEVTVEVKVQNQK